MITPCNSLDISLLLFSLQASLKMMRTSSLLTSFFIFHREFLCHIINFSRNRNCIAVKISNVTQNQIQIPFVQLIYTIINLSNREKKVRSDLNRSNSQHGALSLYTYISRIKLLKWNTVKYSTMRFFTHVFSSSPFLEYFLIETLPN